MAHITHALTQFHAAKAFRVLNLANGTTHTAARVFIFISFTFINLANHIYQTSWSIKDMKYDIIFHHEREGIRVLANSKVTVATAAATVTTPLPLYSCARLITLRECDQCVRGMQLVTID